MLPRAHSDSRIALRGEPRGGSSVIAWPMSNGLYSLQHCARETAGWQVFRVTDLRSIPLGTLSGMRGAPPLRCVHCCVLLGRPSLSLAPSPPAVVSRLGRRIHSEHS
eukprot:scaffold308727_cov36-Tisochrysis_lutea.AAC.7